MMDNMERSRILEAVEKEIVLEITAYNIREDNNPK